MQSKKLGGRTWWNIILFSLVGQLAWNVENMYFNTFLYNEVYTGASQAAVDGTIPAMRAISTMVALSAATAVITTFLMGTLSDRLNKRKVFISVGYILWGVVTAAMGFISREHTAALFHLSDEVKILSVTVWTVIIMDCVMTFMGSTSNDSVFNAWVTDITNPENRQRVETVLAALPVAAMGVVVGVGSFAQAGKIGYDVFFCCLGAFAVFSGVIGLFTLQETKHRPDANGANYWADLFYGFRPSVIKENNRLYLALAALGFFSIAVQVFFPYLLLYIQHAILPASEGIDLVSPGFLIPAVLSVLVLVGGIVLLLRLGGKNKGAALLIATGCFAVGLLALGFAKDLRTVVPAIAPTVIGYAVLMIIFNATVRDFTPESKAGQFQGVRMIFYVLLPMVIGPKLGELAALGSSVHYKDDYGVEQILPTSNMFLYAVAVAVLILVPLVFLVKKGFGVAHSVASDDCRDNES
ncbi:MAG: MFS transporter [Clostridia bacterium]|nr:MFS transporter [Clostridia bacterium]